MHDGTSISPVRVAYECYGELNDTKTNAILICHALTGDSHVAAHVEDDIPGWWDG
ncbi:MAG: homoserine O-acetyltransferase, partial [Myxococcota bacterium]